MIRITATTAIALAALSGCTRGPAAPAPAPASAASPTATTEAAQDVFGRMSVDELASAITNHEPVTIIDNNARERYETGHVPGARWVGHDEVTAAVLPQDRNARLVFYCANEH